jgi:acyl-CoA thioester hydrolase
MTVPFKYRLRVRYHECDGQKVVFNARYGEYVDVGALEYCRTIFGAVEPEHGGFDWRLVHQSMDWKAPAAFDEVLDVEIQTESVGTSSFTLRAQVKKASDETLLVSAKTVYVVYDEASASKAPVGDEMRAKLAKGAPGVIVDCTGQVSVNGIHSGESP